MKSKDQILLEQAYQKTLKENDLSLNEPPLENAEEFKKAFEILDQLRLKSPDSYARFLDLLMTYHKEEEKRKIDSKTNSNKRMVEMLPERPGDEPIYRK
jgi:hypothetical protein